MSARTQGCSLTNYYSSRPTDWRRLVDGDERRQSGSLPLKFRQRNFRSPERLAASFVHTQLEPNPAKDLFNLLLQSWVTLPFSYRWQARRGQGQAQVGWCSFQQGGTKSVTYFIFLKTYIYVIMTFKIFCGFFFFSPLVKNSQKASVRRKAKNGESVWRHFTSCCDVSSLLLWKLFPFLCIFSI